jgi:hypothetical protein
VFVIASRRRRDSETTQPRSPACGTPRAERHAAAVVSSLATTNKARGGARTRSREPDGLQAGCSRGTYRCQPQNPEPGRPAPSISEEGEPTTTQQNITTSRSKTRRGHLRKALSYRLFFVPRVLVTSIDTVSSGVSRGVTSTVPSPRPMSSRVKRRQNVRRRRQVTRDRTDSSTLPRTAKRSAANEKSA